MMRLRTYASLSLVATIAVIYHAFNSRGQFYPAMVYLSTSKINLVLLLNMGLVIMCILWQLTKRVFLGSLREAEVERNYGVPLHLIRELYETFRNFRLRVADYIRYRKITSNMNDRFPDATPEELNASDATCIICREEMTTAKKLNCGHLFHVHCLRSWLERQHTCPTCRALVVPPENGASTAGGQHGSRSDTHRQGTGTTSTGLQGSVGSMPDDNLSQHQTRLQAAAAAAAVYEKSFVYPSANTLVWSPGYTLLPQAQRPLAYAANGESSKNRPS
ncbi:hypothetical protein GH714_020140 [Hevea brasiliensis]|uniref:RING-type E3 ubiquitin transferase n=1 Tax=Hevea brasiliensis TaxID=3981 RepID=A0A6A6M207_HEVBR|nr:hypothetical protein GH714_020140 [Hevea brasiliensis]